MKENIRNLKVNEILRRESYLAYNLIIKRGLVLLLFSILLGYLFSSFAYGCQNLSLEIPRGVSNSKPDYLASSPESLHGINIDAPSLIVSSIRSNVILRITETCQIEVLVRMDYPRSIAVDSARFQGIFEVPLTSNMLYGSPHGNGRAVVQGTITTVR
jgi:hypothetical protein